MPNYIIFLTTIYVKRANLQKNKTKKVCNFFVNFINVTLNLNSTLSLYLNLPRTHTLPSSTVQVNCTVPHLGRVHTYSEHKHLVVYTTYTPVNTSIYTHLIKHHCLLIIVNYVV